MKTYFVNSIVNLLNIINSLTNIACPYIFILFINYNALITIIAFSFFNNLTILSCSSLSASSRPRSWTLNTSFSQASSKSSDARHHERSTSHLASMTNSLASRVLRTKDTKALNNDIKNRMDEVVEDEYTSEYFSDIMQDDFEILNDVSVESRCN